MKNNKKKTAKIYKVLILFLIILKKFIQHKDYKLKFHLKILVIDIIQMIPKFIENLFLVQKIKDNLIRVQIQFLKDLARIEIKIFHVF